MAVCAKLTISHDNWQGFRPNANGCLCQDFAYECLRKVKRFSFLLLKLIARVRTFDGPMAADAKQCMNEFGEGFRPLTKYEMLLERLGLLPIA